MKLPFGFIEVNGTAITETSNAVLFDFGLTEEKWIPKSQLEDWPDVGHNGEVIISEWFAEKAEVI